MVDKDWWQEQEMEGGLLRIVTTRMVFLLVEDRLEEILGTEVEWME